MLPVSKLIGAQVHDSSHKRTGQIQDIIVNPDSGRIDFALLCTNATGTTAADKLVPIPWSLLKTLDSSQYANSERPVFMLSVDQRKLTNAPTFQGADLNQSGWRQRVYSFYGVTPEPSKGGAGSPEGTSQGRRLQEVPPAPK
jgi:sporulation protein YlmC with PRC-barrel domain